MEKNLVPNFTVAASLLFLFFIFYVHVTAVQLTGLYQQILYLFEACSYISRSPCYLPHRRTLTWAQHVLRDKKVQYDVNKARVNAREREETRSPNERIVLAPEKTTRHSVMSIRVPYFARGSHSPEKNIAETSTIPLFTGYLRHSPSPGL